MKTKITIKNFGNDTFCESIEELERSLANYKGQSVSFQFYAPSGIRKVFFVDVGNDGAVRYSNNSLPVIFSAIFETD